MSLDVRRIEANLVEVRRRVESARLRGGWDHEVRILLASKYVPLDDMAALKSAGIRLLGENRAEELSLKWERHKEDFEFHFIGHLQSRKAKLVVPMVSLIHSVDSLGLVQEIDKRTERESLALLQVNVSGEESKYGILPAQAETFLAQSAAYRKVRFVGLMTMAPLVSDPELVRPVFRGLRELRDRLATEFGGRHALPELSMGMSNDYEIAVEEGATIVRLGSVLLSQA